jgi:hypothetical protein
MIRECVCLGNQFLFGIYFHFHRAYSQAKAAGAVRHSLASTRIYHGIV